MTPVADRADAGSTLPAWPVYVLFAGFALWWVLGFAAFAVTLSALPMVVLMIQRRSIEVPAAFALWIVFLLWTLGAAVQLNAHQLIGFAVRFGNFAGCGVLFLYVYNARERLSTRSLLTALAWFFVLVVIGGYLGVLIPHGSITTPAERLLPRSIVSNEYVTALVHPSFAEVQRPYGSPRAFYRPSAPFPYTNSWGCNMALLVPLAIAAIIRMTSRRSQLALGGVLVLAAVPAFASLNRGMYIGLVVGVTYVAVRFALRGRIVPLAGLLTFAGVAAVAAAASGLLARLNERLAYSSTNSGRAAVYREAFDGAVHSPIFGNGAPRASQTVDVAVGTQGQIWNLMYSYGFVALGCFVGWFVLAWWLSRRTRTAEGLWVSAVLVTAIVTFVYYGYDGPQLAVAMAAAGLALRGTYPRTDHPMEDEATPRRSRGPSARVFG